MRRATISVLAILALMSALIPVSAWQNTPTLGVLPDSGPTLPATCVVGQLYFKTTATTGLNQCATANTWTALSTGAGTGTVTSIATTSPITGGTITTTGTIACATCVTAATPSSAIVKSCDVSLGDGTNAITAGTYNALVGCKNDNGATITITGVQCFTDSGTSTCDAKTSHAGTPDILTAPVTGTTAFAAGTQSATTTILTGEWLTATLVTDGTTKRIILHVIGTL